MRIEAAEGHVGAAVMRACRPQPAIHKPHALTGLQCLSRTARVMQVVLHYHEEGGYSDA